jgi:hypothetical protein
MCPAGGRPRVFRRMTSTKVSFRARTALGSPRGWHWTRSAQQLSMCFHGRAGRLQCRARQPSLGFVLWLLLGNRDKTSNQPQTQSWREWALSPRHSMSRPNCRSHCQISQSSNARTPVYRAPAIANPYCSRMAVRAEVRRAPKVPTATPRAIAIIIAAAVNGGT